MGGALGFDMGTLMAMAEPRDIDLAMLSDVLPQIETAMLNGIDGEGEE